jgi:hypothetical protein
VLRRVIDFRYRTAGRFFRLAMVAALLIKIERGLLPGVSIGRTPRKTSSCALAKNWPGLAIPQHHP